MDTEIESLKCPCENIPLKRRCSCFINITMFNIKKTSKRNRKTHNLGLNFRIINIELNIELLLRNYTRHGKEKKDID